MSDLSATEHFAIRAVARHFSAPWQVGERPPAAYLTVAARRIAIDLAGFSDPRRGRARITKARLREDAVAQRVLRNIENAVSVHVPDGQSIILTLGAPIKVPSKLVDALTRILLRYLESGATEVDEKQTILGNRVRFRVLRTPPKWNANVIGFVFSGDPKPSDLATALRALQDDIAAKAKTRMPKGFSGERWLLLGNDDWIADFKTYRRAYSQLPPTPCFRKILTVLPDGRVEILSAD